MASHQEILLVLGMIIICQAIISSGATDISFYPATAFILPFHNICPTDRADAMIHPAPVWWVKENRQFFPLPRRRSSEVLSMLDTNPWSSFEVCRVCTMSWETWQYFRWPATPTCDRTMLDFSFRHRPVWWCRSWGASPKTNLAHWCLLRLRLMAKSVRLGQVHDLVATCIGDRATRQ